MNILRGLNKMVTADIAPFLDESYRLIGKNQGRNFIFKCESFLVSHLY